MSNTGSSIKWEAIREIAAGSLTTSYQNLGGVFTKDSFQIVITNNTNGEIYVSFNGTENQMKFPAQTQRIYDYKTNDSYLKSGTQIQVKWVSAPGVPSGWVGVEVQYV